MSFGVLPVGAVERSYASVLREAARRSRFVEVDPEVRKGKPCIKGTRIPVSMLLHAIEEYGSVEASAKAYGQLTTEQVREAVRFAVSVLESPVDHETSPVD